MLAQHSSVLRAGVVVTPMVELDHRRGRGWACSDVDIVIALITGVAGIIAAVCGVLLAIRAFRYRDRKAAAASEGQLSDMLSTERDARLQAEAELYRAKLLLAQHGIEMDER